MREWSLFKVRDAAWASGRSVFSVQQLAHLIGKPKPVAAVYASRLVPPRPPPPRPPPPLPLPPPHPTPPPHHAFFFPIW